MTMRKPTDSAEVAAQQIFTEFGEGPRSGQWLYGPREANIRDTAGIIRAAYAERDSVLHEAIVHLEKTVTMLCEKCDLGKAFLNAEDVQMLNSDIGARALARLDGKEEGNE